MDGGTVANNPAELALMEAKAIWPQRNVAVLVSLGTGSMSEVLTVQSICSREREREGSV